MHKMQPQELYREANSEDSVNIRKFRWGKSSFMEKKYVAQWGGKKFQGESFQYCVLSGKEGL